MLLTGFAGHTSFGSIWPAYLENILAVAVQLRFTLTFGRPWQLLVTESHFLTVITTSYVSSKVVFNLKCPEKRRIPFARVAETSLSNGPK